MTLIPEFVEGRLVRYVVNTDDELGQSLDLRTDTGQFTGTITPIVDYGADRVRGQSKAASFEIAPVKQVVYLNFQPSYVEGLRDFGLRAVDNKIRERILAVCTRGLQGRQHRVPHRGRRPTSRCTRTSTSSASIRTTRACSATTTRRARTTATSGSTTSSAASTR